MATKFFGIEWEETHEAGYNTGAITRVSNREVGVFYRTSDSIDEPRFDTIDFASKALPLIHEATLAKRPYGFCQEKEKEMMGSLLIRDGTMTPITTAELPVAFPLRISDRIDRILLNFYRANPQYGTPIDKQTPLDFFAHDNVESAFFFDLMIDQELFQGRKPTRTSGPNAIFVVPFYIGQSGWHRIEELERPDSLNSRKVFVAMWFDKSMESTYNKIDSAVRSLGFEPINIGLKEHNNDIVDEIQYEIKRSRFVIADVTQQRQGVYYEAGYAMGLGIPVIWTCRADDMKHVHFDTNHYSHVVWETEDDLFVKLVNRIKGTILV